MTVNADLITKIATLTPSCDDFAVVQPVNIGDETHQNELLLFVKPEIFMVEDTAHVEAALNLVFGKLAEFDAHVDGVAIVGGKVLEEAEIMNRHYGFINRLSRFASQMIDADDKQKIADALGIATIDDYAIYGGHEYLQAFPNDDPFTLDTLWFTKKSIKIRSGFYVQSYRKHGADFLLVNGFHPAQLFHFTDSTHRIVLVLVHSDTAWGTLRNAMVGATFPEKAVPNSIRGTLYAHPDDYGLGSVSIANNGVHLSAGPFEGLFEINNFFGHILDLDVRKQPPLILKKMLAAGLSMEDALKALDNPIVTEMPKPTDLFTATEDVDTDAAVAIWKEAVV